MESGSELDLTRPPSSKRDRIILASKWLKLINWREDSLTTLWWELLRGRGYLHGMRRIVRNFMMLLWFLVSTAIWFTKQFSQKKLLIENTITQLMTLARDLLYKSEINIRKSLTKLTIWSKIETHMSRPSSGFSKSIESSSSKKSRKLKRSMRTKIWLHQMKNLTKKFR